MLLYYTDNISKQKLPSYKCQLESRSLSNRKSSLRRGCQSSTQGDSHFKFLEINGGVF